MFENEKFNNFFLRNFIIFFYQKLNNSLISDMRKWWMSIDYQYFRSAVEPEERLLNSGVESLTGDIIKEIVVEDPSKHIGKLK